MPHREEILNELGDHVSHLHKIENDGFQVPEDYFQDLPDLVLARIAQEELIVPERAAQRGFFDSLLEQFAYLFQPRYAALALASIALLIMAVVLLTRSNPKVNTLALEDLNRSEVVQYIESNLDEFEEELFVSEGESSPENEYLESVLEEIDISTLEELF